MSIPAIPPPLEHLGKRHFSFFPPIRNTQPNEWMYRKATWSEILVSNCRTGEEIWIPRRFLGEVSSVDDPVLIVGLLKELEYKAGAVWPHQRQVITMPIAVDDGPRTSAPPVRGPAPVIGISLAASTDARAGRVVIGSVVLGVVACLVVVGVMRESQIRPRIHAVPRDQSFLDLTRDDDYFAVVRKLGPPAEDHWRAETGELQFRALRYPARQFTVILMGQSRAETRYIGAVDPAGQPVAVVQFAHGGNSAAMLRAVRGF